ncbi:MAG: thiamine-phosphate kinase [Hyphomicrobiaceae bacterium]|nr:thiamine-phosphate kinase [Hyphomicrobiaceae bacterium]
MAEPTQDLEHAMVARLLAPLAHGLPGALGLEDDAAVVSVPPGHDLVVTLDTLNDGVHFLFDGSSAQARDIAAKALAVNVSDLAAKGAVPHAYFLSLALPGGELPWLDSFVAGLAEAQAQFGMALSGGDTTRIGAGLSISITALGLVPAGGMVRRGGARSGDVLYVSGTIGDAVLGLELRREAAEAAALMEALSEAEVVQLLRRHLRPEPRLALASVLRQCQAAAMDVSDGLVIDLDRMCRASRTGARLMAAQVPHSAAASKVLSAGLVTRQRLMTGGDDYEILAAVPCPMTGRFEAGAAAAGIAVTAVGEMIAGGEVVVLDEALAPMTFVSRGFAHL